MRVRTLRVMWKGSESAEAAKQVGLQVVDVVEAHRHTDHALRDAGRLTLLLGEPAVRRTGRMGDGGLGVAKVGGDGTDLRAVDDVERGLARLRGVALAF